MTRAAPAPRGTRARRPGGPADADATPALLDRRLGAWLLDHALLGVVGVVAFAAAAQGVAVATAAAIAVVAVLLVWVLLAVDLGRTGATPGRRVVGVRVLDADTGRPLGVPRGLLRSTLLLPAVVPTAGAGATLLAWSAAGDTRRRAWHDRLVGSLAVDVRAARPAAAAQPTVITAPVPAPPEPPVDEPSVDEPPTVDLGRLGLAARVERHTRPWRLLVDTGEDIVLGSRTLLGRAPAPRADEPGGRLVALPSDDLSLATTHAVLEVAHDGVLTVADRGSAEGTYVVRGHAARRVAAEPLALEDGDVLRCGDRAMRVRRTG
ncbi:hypothetical protein GCM10022215_20350 [Nocardioides fonticola]|uniref:FHA domain-containing protein n=1 Tax=Nocardioides fonticola TaxID=450363 RepID=A0ABP7XJ21_9ACTN